MVENMTVLGNLTKEQNDLLDIQLKPDEIEERQGAFGKMLPYLKRSRAIQKANSIFGRGAWGMRFVKEPTLVRIADRDGQPAGAYYECIISLQVQGCEPIEEIGEDYVEHTSIEECVYAARGWKNLDKEITPQERSKACRTVTEAHIVARYGCVAAALKRVFAYYGRAMGGELAFSNPKSQTAQRQPQPQAHAENNHATERQTQTNQQQNQAPRQAQTGQPPQQGELPASASQQQLDSIRKLCTHLGKSEPANLAQTSYIGAKELLKQLTAEYREHRQTQAQK